MRAGVLRLRLLLPLFAVVVVISGCGTPNVARCLAPAETPTPQGESSAAIDRVVGGIIVRERSYELLEIIPDPVLDATAVESIVRHEVTAGRLTNKTEVGTVPAMKTTDVSFAPALLDVLGSAFETAFHTSDPIAAWVVVMSGQGPDGRFMTIGVVEDVTGAPRTIYVETPGMG